MPSNKLNGTFIQYFIYPSSEVVLNHRLPDYILKVALCLQILFDYKRILNEFRDAVITNTPPLAYLTYVTKLEF